LLPYLLILKVVKAVLSKSLFVIPVHAGQKAQGALNARRAARRVSVASHPGKSTNWTPASAGVTT
jgi:hypothetical protein